LDGERALQLARADTPDVVVLDLMLPGIDGTEVCRELRTFTDAYVIMLTARAEEVDKLIGLAVGTDDYLTKPFSPRELVTRVKAMLRRPRTPRPWGTDAPDPAT
jgi:DNA-binding response OmpR family regulator